MDVGDMVGDKAAGVRTVAVCFGRRVGTAAAGIALAAANAVLVRRSIVAVEFGLEPLPNWESLPFPISRAGTTLP